jgi:hypothetical protein
METNFQSVIFMKWQKLSNICAVISLVFFNLNIIKSLIEFSQIIHYRIQNRKYSKS